MKRFLQTPFWLEFKAAHGWKSLYFAKDADKQTLVPCDAKQPFVSVMVRSFSFLRVKKFSLAYIPMFPECASYKTEDEQKAYLANLLSLTKSIVPYLPKNTLFVRYDPPLDFEQIEARDAMQALRVKGVKKSLVDIQPPDTTIVDLTKSTDDILSGMKNKWRYNIRLASKKGVQVTRHFAGDADFEQSFDEFFTLFEQTSKRDKVQFHAKEYYKDLLTRGKSDTEAGTAYSEKPLITLYLARHEGDSLAGIITLFSKDEAVYLYGASGNIKRNLMPAYLLQWTAMQDAKQYGSPCYDFYGMPPKDDPAHPMHGLYLFKTGFGGKIVHRPGSFDIPLKKTYGLYCAAEKARAWVHKSLLKKLK